MKDKYSTLPAKYFKTLTIYYLTNVRTQKPLVYTQSFSIKKCMLKIKIKTDLELSFY